MKNADIQTIENMTFDSSVLDIRWRVTTLCNYQCEFCIQGDRAEHLRQSRGESPETREQICRRIVSLIERQTRYRSIQIGLIGGEVTILPDFPDILAALAESRFRGFLQFYLTTNFSPDAAYFRRLCHILRQAPQNRKLNISASFYPAYTTREAFAEKLREVARCAQEAADRHSLFHLKRSPAQKVSLSAGIPILQDADYADFLEMRADLQSLGVAIHPIIIRNFPTDLSGRTAETLLQSDRDNIRVFDMRGKEYKFQNIQALGMALEDGDSFCPTGCLCDAGMHNIWIDAFGNVKRCPAIGSTMTMGNLLDDTFRFLEGPGICSSDHCSCNQFGRIERI